MSRYIELNCFKHKGKGRKIEFDTYLSILNIYCKDLKDYLVHSKDLVQLIENLPKRRWFQRRIQSDILEYTKEFRFKINNLIIKDVLDSTYTESESNLLIPIGMGGLMPLFGRTIPIRRRDYILEQDNNILLAYLELSEYTDAGSWTHAIYSNQRDKVGIVVSPPTGKPPHTKIHKLENYSLTKRLE